MIRIFAFRTDDNSFEFMRRRRVMVVSDGEVYLDMSHQYLIPYHAGHTTYIMAVDSRHSDEIHPREIRCNDFQVGLKGTLSNCSR